MAWTTNADRRAIKVMMRALGMRGVFRTCNGYGNLMVALNIIETTEALRPSDFTGADLSRPIRAIRNRAIRNRAIRTVATFDGSSGARRQKRKDLLALYAGLKAE